MAWRYNFTFKMTNSGRRMLSDWLISKGYNVIEQSSEYMILDTQISNLHKTQLRDNITSFMIREEEVLI